MCNAQNNTSKNQDAQSEDNSRQQEQELSPKGAMLRSLAFPGWGQWYNKKRVKALVFFCGEFGLLSNSIYLNDKYQDAINDYNDWDKRYIELSAIPDDQLTDEQRSEKIFVENEKKYAESKKEFYIENRNLSTWWLVGSLLYSVFDAFVDAHLSTFDESPELSFEYNPINDSRSVRVSFRF